MPNEENKETQAENPSTAPDTNPEEPKKRVSLRKSQSGASRRERDG